MFSFPIPYLVCKPVKDFRFNEVKYYKVIQLIRYSFSNNNLNYALTETIKAFTNNVLQFKCNLTDVI